MSKTKKNPNTSGTCSRTCYFFSLGKHLLGKFLAALQSPAAFSPVFLNKTVKLPLSSVQPHKVIHGDRPFLPGSQGKQREGKQSKASQGQLSKQQSKPRKTSYYASFECFFTLVNCLLVSFWVIQWLPPVDKAWIRCFCEKAENSYWLHIQGNIFGGKNTYLTENCI